MKVIINGDDFGLNPSVNEKILDLISHRRITSATLIANAPAVEDAVGKIPRRSNCSFGVHLNLTEFKPLTPQSELGILASCLDEEGNFAGEMFLRRLNITWPLRQAFLKELRLQVDRVVSLGVRISHFDSHNHVHTIPALFPVLKRLQKHFGIRKVRTTCNIYPPGSPARLPLLLKKGIWKFALQHYYHTVTTSGFADFSTFYDVARSCLLTHDSVELMVHPGNLEFEEETRMLDTDWQKEIPFSTKLISYHDL